MTIQTANRLIELRRHHGYSQEDIAAKIGISRQAVSKWERAESAPDVDNLIALARLYKVSLDDLLAVSEEDCQKDADKFCTEEDNAGVSEIAECEAEDIIGNISFDNDAYKDDRNYPYDTTGLGDFYDRKPSPAVLKILYSVYPILCVAVFLFQGTVFGSWHPGWLIFLTIPLMYTLVPSLLKGKSLLKSLEGCYPIVVAIIFLSIGCYLGVWHPTWLIFITIPIYYMVPKK